VHSPSVPDQGVHPGRVRVPAVVRSGATKRGAVESGVPAMCVNVRAQFPGEKNALADPGGEDQNREGRQAQKLDP